MFPALIPVRVLARQALTPDIVCLDLVHADGLPLPAYEPGAHIDLHTPSGFVRPYSLCQDHHPDAPHRPYRVAVLRDATSRGGSQSVHAQLHEGSRLHVSPPRNFFPLHEAAPHSLLLAGGIGITPLLAMAERLHARQRTFSLHLCARSRLHAPFWPALSQGPLGAHVQLHPDDDATRALDLRRVLAASAPGTHVYVCGPRGFMDTMLATARQMGWPEAQLHSESFSPAPPPDATATGTFEVELARSGRVITVGPSQTVATALLACGVSVPLSCEQGLCGTCGTRVLAGEIDHRDFHLSAHEQAAHDQMMVCCSRARSPRIVLDL